MSTLVATLALFASARVPLIIDTDMGGGGCRDVDDVAAVCMASALHHRGEAELLAVVHNTNPPVVAAVTSVLLTYYGLEDVPLGTFRGELQDQTALSYTSDLVQNWPHNVANTSQTEDAVTLYRRVLAKADDHSVTISSIGLLTNLAALLSSTADTYSPLSGVDLVARKVKRLAVMGGEYDGGAARLASPTTDKTVHETVSCECNFCANYNSRVDHATASAASSSVVARMPASVEILYLGVEIGLRVTSGAALSSCAPASNPCRQAFIDYEGGPDLGRYSWDPLTTLWAVRGVRGGSAAGCTDCGNGTCAGVNSVNATTGANTWVHGARSNQSYLILNDAHAAGAAIDELLCDAPKRSA